MFTEIVEYDKYAVDAFNDIQFGIKGNCKEGGYNPEYFTFYNKIEPTIQLTANGISEVHEYFFKPYKVEMAEGSTREELLNAPLYKMDLEFLAERGKRIEDGRMAQLRANLESTPETQHPITRDSWKWNDSSV